MRKQAKTNRPREKKVQTPSDSQSSTRALIERGRGGDASAWERVFDRVTLRVRRWARGRVTRPTGGAAETNDVVQDAAVGVWHRLPQLDFRKSGDLDAYMRRSVVNRIREQARRANARPPILPLDPAQIDDSASPLEQALDAEALERYRRAYAALDVRDREALIARATMGYTFEQVAQLTGQATAAAARMSMKRVIERLRAAVDGESL